MKSKLIYVASPFSHPDKVVQEMRNVAVSCAMGFLMNTQQELVFFSPICHAHPIATYCKLPGDWAFWERYDKAMLSRCDEIWVLCLDGWQESVGVTAELKIAVGLNLPVKFITPVGDGTYAIAGAVKAPRLPSRWQLRGM